MNYTQEQLKDALSIADSCNTPRVTHSDRSRVFDDNHAMLILAAEVRRLQSELEHAGNEIGGLLNWKSRAETAEALVVEKDKALSAIIPMLREWHDDFPMHVGDKESPALKDADTALTLTPSGITSRISKLEADLAARDATIAELKAERRHASETVIADLLAKNGELIARADEAQATIAGLVKAGEPMRNEMDSADEYQCRLLVNWDNAAAKSAAPVSQELAELIETAPKTGERVLGYSYQMGDWFPVKWSPSRPAPHWTVDSGEVVAPTHWMRLPVFPAIDAARKEEGK